MLLDRAAGVQLLKCPAESKMSGVQERFYLSVAGVGYGSPEMVTCVVSKDAEVSKGHDGHKGRM